MSLVWPNGTTTEPARSDGYGPRTSIQTKEGPTRPFHVGTDHVGIGRVRSIGDGTVIESGKYDHVAWAGYQILIYLGEIDGVRTWVRMCHFQGHPPQSRGDTVRIGDFVGLEGNTGQSVGQHLHWEIYRGRVDRGTWGNPGTTVDPRAFVLAHLETDTVPEEDDMPIILKRSDGRDFSRLDPAIGTDLKAGQSRPSRLDKRVTVYRGFEATGDASVGAAWGRTYCRAYKSVPISLDRAAYEAAQAEATRYSLEVGAQ